MSKIPAKIVIPVYEKTASAEAVGCIQLETWYAKMEMLDPGQPRVRSFHKTLNHPFLSSRASRICTRVAHHESAPVRST